jgi:DNA helicase HerA-like ATPase
MTESHEPWARTLELRRSVLSRLSPPPLAWSADGRSFGMGCSVDHDVVPGDYVTLALSDGRRVLGRLLSKSVEEIEGARWSGDPTALVGDEDASDGAALSVSMALRLRTARGEGAIVGQLSDGASGTDVVLGAVDPFDEAVIERASPDVVARLLDRLDADRPTLVVGAVDAGGGALLPARIRTSGFNRHTFVCGQSGSGKTFSLGVLLERLVVETTLRIVVLDPNGDFVRIGELRSDAQVDATRRIPAPDGESTTFRQRHAEVAEGIRVHTRVGSTGLEPVVRLLDMSTQAQAAVFRLDPLDDREEYGHAIDLIDAMRARRANGGDVDDEHVGFDRLEDAAGTVSPALGLRLRNLGLTGWNVWARKRASVIDSINEGARATIADLGALPTDAERYVLALAVLEHLWDHRDERIPTLIVIDEAHNIAPRESSDPIQQMARDLVIRIAGEGRKFGLFLTLASQRPDKVHANVLSQCDNLVLMRMNALADVDELVNTFSFVPEPLIRQSPFFAQGEAVVAGPIASGPTRLAFGSRYTVEGGSDLPTTWADPLD